MVLVPNTLHVIRSGDNGKVHIRENASAYRAVTIADGQYNAITLKDALVTALNTGRSMTEQYTVTYNTTTNKLSIAKLDSAATFHVYPTA